MTGNGGQNMAQTLRAVVENGRLRLLDEMALAEGEEVDVIIKRRQEAESEMEKIRQALGDSVYWPDPDADINPEVADELENIRDALEGLRPLSEIIIEEREGR
jgi:predicted DNA-binding antitoxin AbrB/MazE fold protein